MADRSECLQSGQMFSLHVLHSDFVTLPELDALGDELLLDDDSSYLDEASAAPSIPEGNPSDSKTNKVTLHEQTRRLNCEHTQRSEDPFSLVYKRKSNAGPFATADLHHPTHKSQ